MTQYEALERDLSRLFFGQDGKSVPQMEGEFEALAAMHRRSPSDVEATRNAALVAVADLLHAASTPSYSIGVRTAMLEAATVLVRAYQDTFPALRGSGVLVGRYRRPAGLVRRSEPARLGKGLLSLLVSARAGLVLFVRSGDGVRFERAGRDVTEDVLTLVGLSLVTVPDRPRGAVRITREGLMELR